MERDVEKTRQSFDYQWANLKDSPWLLSSPEFKERCERILLDELALTREQVRAKLVADVGCGNGRWSYAFMNLGAKVVAYDFTKNGCHETKKLGIEVLLADALNPPFRDQVFDIVFSFGVLHHTGDLDRAFSKNAELTKLGGLMHVYLYGKKARRVKLWRVFLQLFSVKMRRRLLWFFLQVRRIPLLYKVIPYSDIHGGFDALSPKINVESNATSVEAMFRKNGFEKTTRVKVSWSDWKVDVHMQGIRREKPFKRRDDS